MGNEDTRDLWWLSGAIALTIGAGMALGGREAVLAALGLALALCLVVYWFKDDFQLMLLGAIRMSLVRTPSLYELVRDLARQAGVPMPKVYLVPKARFDAYVIGRHAGAASLVLTDGILKFLGHEELQGELERAIAHGLAHVKEHDRLHAVAAAALSGVLAQFATIFLALDVLHLAESSPGYGFSLLVTAPLGAAFLHQMLLQAREARAEQASARILQARQAKRNDPSPRTTGTAVARVPGASSPAARSVPPTPQASRMASQPAPAETVGVPVSTR